jgi:chromosome segregation ATPase
VALHLGAGICAPPTAAYNFGIEEKRAGKNKKVTLESIAAQIASMDLRFNHLDRRLDKIDDRTGKLDTRMEKSFAAAKDDITDLKHELKGDIAGVQEQVNSIESELKSMRVESRLGDLETKVFGAPGR